MSSNTINDELHISGRIDSFIFGKIKNSYYRELKNVDLIMKKGNETDSSFLKLFFSLFLENNPFSEKTNIETFKESIQLKKFENLCPNFFAIYATLLKDGKQENKVVIKDTGLYLETKTIRSTHYDHYSFLQEILDSPNFSNRFRVFSIDNFIQYYSNGEIVEEKQLGKFMELKEAVYDDDYNFVSTSKQSESLNEFYKLKLGFPGFELAPIATTRLKSVQYDGFWPLDFFNFVLGNSTEVFEESLYSVIEKNYQYSRELEVRVDFSNLSRCIFKFESKIDFEKLLFLRCGLDEGCRSEAINYGDDINLFNYIAYDGQIIHPEEIIMGDKGITFNQTLAFSEDLQPLFCKLFID